VKNQTVYSFVNMVGEVCFTVDGSLTGIVAGPEYIEVRTGGRRMVELHPEFEYPYIPGNRGSLNLKGPGAEAIFHRILAAGPPYRMPSWPKYDLIVENLKDA
jgi:hypothetical protein